MLPRLIVYKVEVHNHLLLFPEVSCLGHLLHGATCLLLMNPLKLLKPHKAYKANQGESVVDMDSTVDGYPRGPFDTLLLRLHE